MKTPTGMLARSPKLRAQKWAVEERRTEVARLSRLGWTERAIASHFGVSPGLIAADFKHNAAELLEHRVSDTEQMRALSKERIHLALVAVMRVLREAKAAKQPETIMKAADRLVHLEERLARMFGTDAPEKVSTILGELSDLTPEAIASATARVFGELAHAGTGDDARDGRVSADDRTAADPGVPSPGQDPDPSA